MLHILYNAADFGKLTSFFSSQYLFFFLPLVVVLYALTPKAGKRYTLLLASLAFYFLISLKYTMYLLATIVLVWLFGLWLNKLQGQRDTQIKAAEKAERKAIKHRWMIRCRYVLGLAVVIHIGLLLTLKYSGFFLENVNVLLNQSFRIPSFVVPIGISFFTLQAVSYLVDVYRGTQKADRNILRLALFISFFPQIVEGPICRYNQTAQQLWDVKPITWKNLTFGMQRILYGMMKKLVIADRLNAFVEEVFAGYDAFQGGVIAIAAVCYTVQLYMDFSGAMDAVAGTAEIFGVVMPENFRQPFFSKTVSEFWTRWHISLGGFFKDYIFYPVSMSKPVNKLVSSVKKKAGHYWAAVISAGIAFFCVWFCNGLWHGASWNYIFFGMYHFALIFMGRVFAPCSKWCLEKLRISPENHFFRLFQIFRTCVLVVIGELFFRAGGLKAGLEMFWRMVTDFRFSSINMALWDRLFIDPKDFLIVGVTLVIVFTISLLNERGIHVRQLLSRQHILLRWAIWYVLIFYIITFGAYGVGYVPVDPMYANF